MSRRSPSYEMRLAKYASRGYEIYVPNLRRDDINPAIFSLRPSLVHGLARLLVLERRMINVASHNHPDNLSEAYAGVIDAISSICRAEETSQYSSLHLPYGRGWTSRRLKSWLERLDMLLNRDEDITGVHYHPAFFGTAQDCIEGTCDCQSQEGAAANEQYVRGHITFFKENPGRQAMSGSFNPTEVGEWSTQAYRSLPDAQVERSLQRVQQLLQEAIQLLETARADGFDPPPPF
ncbi:uncharacterized protein ARMOST_22241 [Armillaria ostoyae]|uniref:Uncharacterized protein n=1 Tax=Armillaria ostoyae TaxID=47428 RepID=A0A284SCA8_ARMOS|nr:uncharacterized protein ARMOST_22241 [Armillaria ostoyae]